MAPNTPSAPQTSASVPATPSVNRAVAEGVELRRDEIELRGEILKHEDEHGIRGWPRRPSGVPSTRERQQENGNSDSRA